MKVLDGYGQPIFRSIVDYLWQFVSLWNDWAQLGWIVKELRRLNDYGQLKTIGNDLRRFKTLLTIFHDFLTRHKNWDWYWTIWNCDNLGTLDRIWDYLGRHRRFREIRNNSNNLERFESIDRNQGKALIIWLSLKQLWE